MYILEIKGAPTLFFSSVIDSLDSPPPQLWHLTFFYNQSSHFEMRAFGTIFATLTLAVSASAAAIYPRDTVNNAGGLAALTTTVKDIVSGVSLAKQDVKSRQLPGGNVVSEVTNVLGNTPVGGVAPRQLPGGNVVSEVTNVLGNTPVGGVVPRQLPGVNAGSVVSTVKSVLGNTPVGGVAPRGEQGVPDVINGVIVQIKPILVDIG